MIRSLRTIVLAASVCSAALTLAGAAQARDEAAAGATVIAASPSDVAARAELATPKVKRPRRATAQRMRRVAAVAAPPAYHSRCFLFFCNGGGGSPGWLLLGVAY